MIYFYSMHFSVFLTSFFLYYYHLYIKNKNKKNLGQAL